MLPHTTSLTATEAAYKRALTHRDYAQAGTKSGMRPPIDLTRAQADVSALEVRLIRAETGLQASRAALAAAMGSDRLEVDAVDTPPDLSAAPAFAEAMRAAAQRNPAIVAALAKLDAEHAAVSAVTRELLPNVFASASLTGRAGGAAPTSGNTPYGGGWLPDVANWHLGLVLQWNLFDATILARRAAAKAHEDAARADLELARMAVGLSAERAYLDLDAALRTLPGLHAAVEAARANQAQAEARFKAGLGTIVELADAEALLTGSQLELAVGQFTVARARAALGRVMAQSFVRGNQ
jgi:outer membrane protein